MRGLFFKFFKLAAERLGWKIGMLSWLLLIKETTSNQRLTVGVWCHINLDTHMSKDL